MTAPWPAPPTEVPLSKSFWRQLTSSVISNLGDGIDAVAMPLLLLTLTSDERILSIAVAIATIPWIVLALPLGVAVDRYDRKRLMVGASAIRAVLFVAVAAGAIGGWLEVWQLISMMVVANVCEVVYDSAAQAFLPLIVEPPALTRANGMLASAEFIAGGLVGISVGALLFDLDAGLPFGLNAVAFVTAAVLTQSVRVRLRPPTPGVREADSGGLRDGLRWLRRHRTVRTLAEMLALTNLGLMLGQGVYAKYVTDELGLRPAAYGILLAITAIGAATGGFIAGRVLSAFGMRTGIALPYLAFVAGNVAIGAAEQAWIVGVAAFVLGSSITVWNVLTISLRQQEIPTELFGRVNGVFRLVGYGATAVSIALGGLLAHATTVRMPFLVGGVISSLTILLYGRRAFRGLAAVG